MIYKPLTTVDDMQSKYYAGTVFSDSTRPTVAEVTSWILEASNEVFTLIGRVYTLPITSKIDLQLLKSRCEIYVKDRIDFATGKMPKVTLANGTSVTRELNHKLFISEMDRILNGEVPLLYSNKKSIIGVSYNSENAITPFYNVHSGDIW